MSPGRGRALIVWGLPIVIGLTMLAYVIRAEDRFEAALVGFCGLLGTMLLVIGDGLAVR